MESTQEIERLGEIGKKWEKIDGWYQLSLQEIYPEPRCMGHVRGTKEVIKAFIVPRLGEIKSVLDVGCGVGDASRFFKALGIVWVGITLGQHDIQVCRKKSLRVFEWDAHWVDFPEDSVDCCYVRHLAEHSPMPLFLLKEMARLSKKYLLLVVPRPPHFCIDKDGRKHPNHPSAGLTRLGWIYLCDEAGWELIAEDYIPAQIEERMFFRLKGTNYP